jgi:Conserved oligomeric complex COG6
LIVLTDRQEVADKKTVITLFLARFTLDEAEVEARTSRDIPIGRRFFDAMDKTERIREEKIAVFSWRVKMDQQKPGGFHYPTLIKYYIHPSFLKVGNYVPLLRIWNKATRSSFDTVLTSFVRSST